MATIVNALSNSSNLSDLVTTSLNGAYGIQSVAIGGVTYVYVAGELEDGIQILTLDGAGVLSTVGTELDDSGLALNGVRGLEIVEVGGTNFLIASSNVDEGISVFSIGSDGLLTNTDNVFDDTGNLLRDIDDMTTARVGNNTYLFTASSFDDTITVFQISNSGVLTEVDRVIDNTDLAINFADDLDTVVVGGTTFLIASGASDSGISVFEVLNNGTLVNTDNVFDTVTTELSGIRTIEIVDIDGTPHIFAGGWGDVGISVFTVDGSGSLVPVRDIPLNTPGTRPDNIEAVNINGARLLFVTDSNRNAIDVYAIEDDASLTFLETALDTDDPNFELNDVFRTDIVKIGNNYFLIAPGYSDDGISVFQIGGGEDALVGTGEDDIIVGGASDDDLLGRGGNDEMFGGDGDDVLVGRRGSDLLEGGDGADILLGGAGTNMAGYSESDAAVTVNLATETHTGGHAAGDILIDIQNIRGSAFNDTLTGDDGNNRIEGGDGGDTISGGGSRDKLYGDAGGDTLFGDEGNDLVKGGGGGDELFGGDGRDNLNGGGGNDELSGDADDDTLRGGSGNDTLEGGADNDLLLGGGGADILIGGIDDDIMDGGGGADVFVLVNGDGADQIDNFQNGTDLIDLSGHVNANSFGDLTIFDLGDDVLVIIDNNDSVLLTDFDPGNVNGADFIF